MKTNLEVKSPIENYEEFKRATKELGKQFSNRSYYKETQQDIYYSISNSPAAITILPAEKRGAQKQNSGRLKLRVINHRSGSLIYYNRSSKLRKRVSNYTISKTKDFAELDEIMRKLFGVKVVVEKTREIFIYDNIRIHLDRVKNLGNFLEFEVIFNNLDKAKKQLNRLIQHYKLDEKNFIKESYSDMLLKNIPEKCQ